MSGNWGPCWTVIFTSFKMQGLLLSTASSGSSHWVSVWLLQSLVPERRLLLISATIGYMKRIQTGSEVAFSAIQDAFRRSLLCTNIIFDTSCFQMTPYLIKVQLLESNSTSFWLTRRSGTSPKLPRAWEVLADVACFWYTLYFFAYSYDIWSCSKEQFSEDTVNYFRELLYRVVGKYFANPVTDPYR